MSQFPTEQDLITKSKAPRVTLEDLEDNIVAEHYFTAYEGVMGAAGEATYEIQGKDAPAGNDLEPLRLMTFCVLVLRNGFTVQGTSACASPDNFNREIGNAIARKDAADKIWPLMGYELKTILHHAPRLVSAQGSQLEAA